MRVRWVLATGVGAFQAADTPVEVGRETVGQVVERSQLPAHDKGLVAHQHAHAEVFPCKFFGRFESSHGDEATLAVDDGRLAVDDVGTVFPDEIGYFLQGVGLMEAVARIEEDEIVAVGGGDAFVHGVVEPVVGFAHDVRHAGVLPGYLYRRIAGGSVDEKVFILLAGLCGDRFEGGSHRRGGIEGNRNNREKRCFHAFRVEGCCGNLSTGGVPLST